MIQPWTDNLIALLNEVAALDPRAIRELVEHRVDCNAALQEHPTVQVEYKTVYGGLVGMLGVLNGFCGTVESGERAGWGPITAVLDDNGGIWFQRTE